MIWGIHKKKSKEIQIAAAGKSNVNLRTNAKATKSRKQKWEEKQLFRNFKWQIGEIAHKMTLEYG